MEDSLDTTDCSKVSKVTKKGASQLHFGDNKGTQCKLFSIQSRNNLSVYNNNKEWLLSIESLIFVTNKLL